ncbi:MAG: AbrB/MazE/SpoVT family DNA-binding domain-containing protein [Candidatus Vogelbacteria bacterium]|nr:AbrB/MazE/SpoVT family DNA-binding domain-containing protein [Candidatus Vogelbacteria bacterium]
MKTTTNSPVNISKVGQRRQVVIPKKIFDSVGLKIGHFIEVSQKGNEVVIRPQAVVHRDEVLTPAEEKLVARGFRQLKRGEHIIWKDLKHEQGL